MTLRAVTKERLRKFCDEGRLFNSDTEDDEVSGFIAQELEKKKGLTFLNYLIKKKNLRSIVLCNYIL